MVHKFSIGSDESLKGDTFGGIVVAGVLVDDELKKALAAIGVADSKTLSAPRITLLAKQIKAICPYSIVKELEPVRYNEYKQTSLLNQLHAECAQELRAKHAKDNDLVFDTASAEEMNFAAYTHIVDEFPGCTVGDIHKPKAESLYIEVAAASILARDAAVKQIDRLSKQLGFRAPLGSTHVAEALFQLKVSGKPPEYFVKMHFKNVQSALGSAYLKDQRNEF